MDRFLGLINVLGEFCIPTVGFNIGSNLAAGGSALFAAMMEHKWLQTLNVWIRREIFLNVLILRWYDDMMP